MAIAAIKSLKKYPEISIVGADSNKLAAGLYLCHKKYVVPEFNDDYFWDEIKHLIKKEDINVIIPALDHLLLPIAQKKEELESIGVKVLISDEETIEITRDKWRTYRKLKDVIPFPKSFIKKEDIDIDYPLIIKPRGGSGSIDVHKINSREELEFFFKRVHNPIIQDFLSGEEYTVDCLSGHNGGLLVSIPRIRIETKAGISVKGKIIKNELLDEMAQKIANNISLNGPFFFQVKEDEKNVPRLTEINSRISGTMSLSNTAGPNIHALSIKMCMGEKLKIPEIKYDTYITRYWEDIYLTEGDLDW